MMKQLRSDRSAQICFVLLLLAAGAWIFYLARDTTLFRDEWTFLLFRDGRDSDSFFQSHDGQQVPGMVVFYLFFFKVFGLADYDVYRLAVLPMNLGSSALVYWIAARRMGWWGAVAPAFLVLLGFSVQDLFWPFTVLTFVGVACLGMIAWLAAERRTVATDALAVLALVLALTLSGYAIAWVAGALVGVVVQGDRWWRRLWVPGVPALAYLVWSHLYGTTEIDLGNLFENGPDFIYRMAVEVLVVSAGFPRSLATLAFLALLGWILYRLVTLGREALIAWQAMAALAVFWLLTALVRANGDPLFAIADRYLYASGLLVVLALVAVAPASGPARRWYAGGLAAACLLMLPHWVNHLEEGAEYLRNSAENTRSELGAIELAGRETVGEGNFDTREYGLAAGLYFDAVHKYESSPAFDLDGIRSASPEARGAADALMIGKLRVARPARLRDGTDCVPIEPGTSFTAGDLARRPVIVVPRPGQTAVVALRRFGELQLYTQPWMARPFRLGAPDDAAVTVPWRAELSGDTAAEVCSAGRLSGASTG